MGLDMHLHAEKFFSGFEITRDEEFSKILAAINVNEADSEKSLTVSIEVGYWRKANCIHKWFVDNVQEGEDDCGDYEVSNDKLKELLDLIDQVLANKKKAHKLLPNQSGFFFGSQDYDEYYFQDLEYTKKLIEGVLASDLGKKGWYLEYTSSWWE